MAESHVLCVALPVNVATLISDITLYRQTCDTPPALYFSDSEEFEELDVEAYSSPPELPDVMKEHQDPSGMGHEGM